MEYSIGITLEDVNFLSQYQYPTLYVPFDKNTMRRGRATNAVVDQYMHFLTHVLLIVLLIHDFVISHLIE